MSSTATPGAPTTESAPGETNAPKVESSAEDVKPTTESEMAEDNKKATGASNGEIKAAVDVKKEEEDTEPATEGQKEEKIVQDAVKQITFYLSDSNLPYDKFLFTQAQRSLPEKDSPMGTGWIALSTILSFKRMQEIISRSSRSVTICEFAIVNALRAAYPSNDADALLEVSGGGDEIRRKKELVPPSQTGQMDRSVYAKGFPEEAESSNKGKENGDSGRRGGKNDYNVSQLQKELEKFFGSLGLGKVNAVRMRRDEGKGFKGSVFVEFATLESAKAFLELDPKPTYPGQSEPLETMSKKEYIDMKAKEKGIAPVYAANKDASKADSSARNGGTKRPFNAFKDFMSVSGEGSGSRGGRGGDDNKNVTVFVEGKEMDVDTETGNLKNPEELQYSSGKVARFEGASTSDESDAITLKNNLQSIHPAAYVNFEKGNSSGIVFFKDPVSDEKYEALQTAKLTLGGKDNVLSWTIIKDDEEKQFHLDRANKRASIALADHKSGRSDDRDRRGGNRDRDSRGRGGGRGRGGRGRGRGGRDDRGGDRRDDRDRRGGGRGGDRDRNEENSKKREREEDVKPEVPSPAKGNSINVPKVDSSGPAPDAKRVKTE